MGEKTITLFSSPSQPDLPGAPCHDLSRGHPRAELHPQLQESWTPTHEQLHQALPT